MRRFAALYLGRCHAEGWTPTYLGLLAFVDQIRRKLLLPDGRMHCQS